MRKLEKGSWAGNTKNGAGATDRTAKRKAPLSNDNGALSGELGTRTPDPLRVMHDNFSIFKSIIRKIEAICYKSATNGKFSFLLHL